jgi:hypothetical protein
MELVTREDLRDLSRVNSWRGRRTKRSDGSARKVLIRKKSHRQAAAPLF